MVSRVAGRTRSGSSMPLKAARPRHSDGSSYSRKATEWRLSPADTTWMRRPARAPEVGLVPAGSLGISSRLIWAVARTGLPSELNIVYLTLTDLRKHLNPSSGPWPPPQWNSSAWGWGLLSECDFLVGVSQ